MKEQITFDLWIPIFFYLRDLTCIFFSGRRDRAPGKWVKSLPCFVYGSKIIGEAQRLWLPNPAGYPFGDACGTSPACHPGLLQVFSHSSSASPAAAARFLPCIPRGRSCSRASVGVTATFVKNKFWSRNVAQNSSVLLPFPGNTTPTRRLRGTEGMKAYCRASELVSSNTASQYKNFSHVVWHWFKVVCNAIKGESSFRIIGNNFFPLWAGFENCWIYSCISSQSFWMWLKLAALRVGLQLNERVFLQPVPDLGL